MADIKDPKNTIVMETTKGKVWIELFPDLAPNHVERIKELTRKGFYDGCTFFDVNNEYVQTGDPKGMGRGGALGWYLNDEFSERNHIRGTCSMVKRATPNSADSQFFICVTGASYLNGKNTIWGQVIDGMENIDKLKQGVRMPDPDKIISMKIVEDPVVTPGRNQGEDIDPETKLIKQQTVQQSSTSVLGPTKQLPVDVLK
ncbi:peptidylprolyl isomerase [Pseudomonas sp. MWU13-2625]|nr:peptidylprolyl isomerase [Pseudomonas sp. MWU13-2625]